MQEAHEVEQVQVEPESRLSPEPSVSAMVVDDPPSTAQLIEVIVSVTPVLFNPKGAAGNPEVGRAAFEIMPSGMVSVAYCVPGVQVGSTLVPSGLEKTQLCPW